MSEGALHLAGCRVLGMALWFNSRAHYQVCLQQGKPPKQNPLLADWLEGGFLCFCKKAKLGLQE